MPGYAGQGQAVLLRDNKQVYLLQRETIVAGRASIAVQLERINRSYYPWGVSFQVAFTDVNGNPSDPGTFEVDIQTSDIDQDNQYSTTTSNTITIVNSSFAGGRLELTAFYAKYARALVKTLTNAVYVTVLATR